MRRREFLGGLAAVPLLMTTAGAQPREAWLWGVAGRTGDTRALERLGVWLQVAARRRDRREAAARVLRALQESQEADGYVGVYSSADRLGGSDRGVDEYWGLAELGRGLLDLNGRGDRAAGTVARRLGGVLITVSPDRLDRDPSQQHTGGAALLYFLTVLARQSREPTYAEYLRLLPSRMGLPGAKSEFGFVLPPVLDRWGPDPLRNARGVAALSGIVALGRYLDYRQLQEAVRERWSELQRGLPADAGADLLARWARLTVDLRSIGDGAELERERERLRKVKTAPDPPFSELLRVMIT